MVLVCRHDLDPSSQALHRHSARPSTRRSGSAKRSRRVQLLLPARSHLSGLARELSVSRPAGRSRRRRSRSAPGPSTSAQSSGHLVSRARPRQRLDGDCYSALAQDVQALRLSASCSSGGSHGVMPGCWDGYSMGETHGVVHEDVTEASKRAESRLRMVREVIGASPLTPTKPLSNSSYIPIRAIWFGSRQGRQGLRFGSSPIRGAMVGVRWLL